MKRNWSQYNEHLVKRGEFYLCFDFLDNWDHEIKTMNKEKRGRPFKYPRSFIAFTTFLKTGFSLQYRQTEGVLRALSQYIPKIKPADYTTLWRRINRISLELPSTNQENVVVAIDSTGIKVTNRGEWMREKWKRHRGWIKVHIAVDVETNELLAIEVTNERTGDNAVAEKLIMQADRNVKSIKKVLADGAYDTRAIFNLLKKRGIEAGIKIRKNASTRSRGSFYRARCVRERNRLGEEQWKKKKEYGKRWAVETYFSAAKRLLGEYVTAKRPENAMKEVKLKFLLYTMLNKMDVGLQPTSICGA